MKERPPGPKGRWLGGSLPEYRRDPIAFLTRCAQEYGDVVQFRFGVYPIYLLNHPDYVEYALVAHHRNFTKHAFARNILSRILGNGLLFSEGQFWLRQRRLVQPAFHRERIINYGEIMVRYAERMISSWQDGEVRDVHQEMMELTLEIVAQALFSADVTNEAEEVGALMGMALEEFSRGRSLIYQFLPASFPTPHNLRTDKIVRGLDRIIQRIIAERRAEGRDKGDLLSMLMNVRDEDGSQMTDRQLRDEVMTLFLAGHETTALALSWAWYLLSQHPDVEARLVTELHEVLDGRTPGLSDLPRLRYTEQVVKEAMRLYPPAWIVGRQAVERCVIGGYDVPAGTTLLMSQWLIHRDARYFPAPQAFFPDRWTDEFVGNLPKYAYFPFGGGPRQCVGYSFAMMEATLLLAAVAQKFHLRLLPGQSIAPWPSLTLRPRQGIQMQFLARPSAGPGANSFQASSGLEASGSS